MDSQNEKDNQNMEEWYLSSIACRIVVWCSLFGRKYIVVNLQMLISYSTIQCLFLYFWKSSPQFQAGTWLIMFVEVENWRQLRYLLLGEWKKQNVLVLYYGILNWHGWYSEFNVDWKKWKHDSCKCLIQLCEPVVKIK